MNIPEYEMCCTLLERYEVPEHIIEHSRKVALISLYLGECLQAVNLRFDPRLLLSAALLHDIAKMESIKSGRDHAKLGAEWLVAEGFPDVAEVVLNHVILETDLSGPIVAKEIVYYADKRVRHTEIVTVVERYRDLRLRYGVGAAAGDRFVEFEDLTLGVEKKLFMPLNIKPESIFQNSIKKNLLTYIAQTNIKAPQPRDQGF